MDFWYGCFLACKQADYIDLDVEGFIFVFPKKAYAGQTNKSFNAKTKALTKIIITHKSGNLYQLY